MKKTIISLILFAFVSPAFALEKVTSVSGITEYRLENGMQVLLFPDPTKQTITVNVTYLVGSVHENYGETGMAHLLEHMLFKGSPKHPNLRKEMEQRGARWNASTWLDRTNYYEILPATDENLEYSLEMEADRMLNSNVTKKDLDSEMTVVRNEFEAGENNPFGVLMERMISSAYIWHNYGKTTIGARADIENVPIERLQAFYKNYYQPDNAALLIAGQFNEAKALEWIQKYFGALPKPKRTLQKFYTEEPTQDGERDVTLRRVGDVQYAGVVYHVPSGSDPDFPAIDIFNEILTDSPSGRIYKALVETKKASSVFGFPFQLRQPGILLAAAEVRKDSPLAPAREALLSTIEDYGKTPTTQEEVDRARSALLKNIDLMLNSADRVGLELSEWIAMGDWRLFFLHREKLSKVTTADVDRVASKYFKSSNRTAGVFLPDQNPDRAEIPDPPNIAEMMKDFKGEPPIAPGEAFDPSPQNIETRTTRFDMPGGIKVALLPKKTRGASVVSTLVFRFGDEASLQNRGAIPSLTGAMLMRGTKKHTRQQIQEEFDRLKARAGVSGSASRASGSLETIRENLPAVLTLIAEILREPSFPEKEFDLLKEERLAEIEQLRNDPEAVAQLELDRHLNQYPSGDPRYVMTLDEQIAAIKAVTLDDAKKFYAEFYGGSAGQIAVVGDFDKDEIQKHLTSLFDSWKSPGSYKRIPDIFQDIPAENKSLPVPDKPNSMFLAGLNLNIRDDDPDYPALAFGNYILGEASNARLNERIREKEGLSYGVGSFLYASPLDRTGGFGSYAIQAPENIGRVEAAFMEELKKAIGEGYTEEEIKIAKSGYQESERLRRTQDRSVSSSLASYLFLGRTFSWDEEFEKKVLALNKQQIQDAMRKYLDPAKISVIKAGDFKTTK
jgi:zinc protease